RRTQQPARRGGVRMSRLSRDELFELAAAYALGATTPEESAEIETAMASSPELAAEVASFREVTAELAKIKTVPPSPAIRDRLMRRAREAATVETVPTPTAIPSIPRARRPGRATWVAAAAAIVVLIGLSA